MGRKEISTLVNETLPGRMGDHEGGTATCSHRRGRCWGGRREGESRGDTREQGWRVEEVDGRGQGSTCEPRRKPQQDDRGDAARQSER